MSKSRKYPVLEPTEQVGIRASTSSATSIVRLTLLFVAAFMFVLDSSIVNVALPSIERELGISTGVAQWLVTGYVIAFGGLLVFGGRAADLLGRKATFIVGLTVFSVASLAAGLAHDPVMLIFARVIQGAGAAATAPAALSLITTSFPEGPHRTRAIGLYGSISSVGFVFGQVFGGVLVEWMGWRSVFLVNVPIGLVSAALGMRMIRTSTGDRASGRRRLDIPGALLITSAMGAIVLGISQGDEMGWTSVIVLASFGFSVVAGTVFVQVESRHQTPLIPLDLVKGSTLRGGISLALLVGLCNGGELLLLSLYLQQALRVSPMIGGLLIAPQGAAGLIAGLLGPRLSRRFGVHRMVVISAGTAAIGLAVLANLPAAGYSPALSAVVLVGYGTTGAAFGSIVIASAAAGDADQGLVSGMVNTSRQIGTAIGTALIPAVADAFHGGITGVTGDRVAMIVVAGTAVIATGIAWRAAPKTGHPES